MYIIDDIFGFQLEQVCIHVSVTFVLILLYIEHVLYYLEVAQLHMPATVCSGATGCEA